MISKGSFLSPKINLLDGTFLMSYHAPQAEIVCQCYAPEKLIHQTTQNGVHKTIGFSSSRVTVLDFLYDKFLGILIVKSSSHECEYPSHLFSEISCHHYSDSFTLYFTVLYILHINRNCVLLYIFSFGYISNISFILLFLFQYLCIFMFYISALISC
jgi:hypothetical protein